MKPILFPEGQTSFNTNGIGRLPDAISCTVTEERNGQYELHMEYPIDGQLMGEIRYSRIIVATPADNKCPQAFRIYRISKLLSGVVEIDAEHISYQMTHIPIMPFSVDGMSLAFSAFRTYAAETNPFTFTHEGSFGEALAHSFIVKEPDNLRALLFGQEGSVIDVYGGEWEFDQYTAILHKARGADNGVTIRYGKNLTDLKQEENIESTYTGICPLLERTADRRNGKRPPRDHHCRRQFQHKQEYRLDSDWDLNHETITQYARQDASSAGTVWRRTFSFPSPPGACRDGATPGIASKRDGYSLAFAAGATVPPHPVWGSCAAYSGSA